MAMLGPKSMNYSVLSKTIQQITMEIINSGGSLMIFTAVYGSNWKSTSLEVWRDLLDVHHKHEYKT